MIQLKLKPNLVDMLQDVVDFDTNETFKGTEYIVATDELLQKLSEGTVLFPLISLGLNEEYGIMEICAQVIDSAADPIHETWIEALVVDGTEYKISHTASWSSSSHIKLSKRYHFFDLATQTIIVNDSVCIECGQHLTAPTEYKICNSCVDKLTKLESYSYKPTPKFQTVEGETTEEFYGIELEYGFKKRAQAAAFMQQHGDVLYLKQDSSISGGEFRAEVVSHPHSFAKLMSPDSYINTLDSLKVEHKPSNGCHIHISRKAFKDRKHFTIFYFLLHNSRELLEFVGGRTLNNYCEFSPTGEVHTKENITDSGQARGKALNETNQSTVEVRIFKSSSTTAEVRRFIQFVDSLVQFSKTDKLTVSLKSYFSFVKTNKAKYPELASHLNSFDPSAHKGFKFRDPIITEYTANKISLTALFTVTEIILKNGTKYSVHPSNDMYINKNKQELSCAAVREGDSSYNTVRIKIKDIETLRTKR